MVTHLVLAIAILVAKGQLDSLQLTTTSDSVAGTTGTVTATLNYDGIVYQCTFQPTVPDTTYTCMTSDNCCTAIQAYCDRTTDGRLILFIDSTNAVFIETLTLNSQTSTVSINGWCVDTTYFNTDICSSSVLGSGLNLCNVGETHVTGITITNNHPTCPVSVAQVFTMFEEADTNTGEWNDITGESIPLEISCDPTIDPTIDPTADPTTDPTYDPTTMPTTPTATPTAAPTRDSDDESSGSSDESVGSGADDDDETVGSGDDDDGSGSGSDSEDGARFVKHEKDKNMVDASDSGHNVIIKLDDFTLMNVYGLLGILVFIQILWCCCKNNKREKRDTLSIDIV